MISRVTDIQRSLERVTGTMNPNITQIAKATGHSRDYVRAMLYGVACNKTGREKRYYSGDVANVMAAEMWR